MERGGRERKRVWQHASLLSLIQVSLQHYTSCTPLMMDGLFIFRYIITYSWVSNLSINHDHTKCTPQHCSLPRWTSRCHWWFYISGNPEDSSQSYNYTRHPLPVCRQHNHCSQCSRLTTSPWHGWASMNWLAWSGMKAKVAKCYTVGIHGSTGATFDPVLKLTDAVLTCTRGAFLPSFVRRMLYIASFLQLDLMI